MAERWFTYQDADGIRRTKFWDSDDPDRFWIRTEQDIEQILNGIKRDRETMRHGTNKHVAKLPVHIFERMIQEGWGPDDERKWLNSSEAREYRIWQGDV